MKLQCDNILVLKELVKDDDLILLTTHAAVADDLAAGTLAPLSFAEALPLFAEISIVQLSGRSLSPAAALLIQKFRRVAAEAPATEMLVAGL